MRPSRDEWHCSLQERLLATTTSLETPAWAGRACWPSRWSTTDGYSTFQLSGRPSSPRHSRTRWEQGPRRQGAWPSRPRRACSLRCRAGTREQAPALSYTPPLPAIPHLLLRRPTIACSPMSCNQGVVWLSRRRSPPAQKRIHLWCDLLDDLPHRHLATVGRLQCLAVQR